MTQSAKKRGVPDLWTSVLVLSLSAYLLLSMVGRRQDEARRVKIAAFVAEQDAFLTKANKEMAELKAKDKFTPTDWKRLNLIKKKLDGFKARYAELCK